MTVMGLRTVGFGMTHAKWPKPSQKAVLTFSSALGQSSIQEVIDQTQAYFAKQGLLMVSIQEGHTVEKVYYMYGSSYEKKRPNGKLEIHAPTLDSAKDALEALKLWPSCKVLNESPKSMTTHALIDELDRLFSQSGTLATIRFKPTSSTPNRLLIQQTNSKDSNYSVHRALSNIQNRGLKVVAKASGESHDSYLYKGAQINIHGDEKNPLPFADLEILGRSVELQLI